MPSAHALAALAAVAQALKTLVKGMPESPTMPTIASGLATVQLPPEANWTSRHSTPASATAAKIASTPISIADLPSNRPNGCSPTPMMATSFMRRVYRNCNSYSIVVQMTSLTEHTTFCRICEPLCGMVATVEDGRLVALRPDKDHPLSSGFACQKGIAFTEVVNDPDRVTTPLRRGPNGFEPVSWDESMSDIANRLIRIHRRHGSGAIGWYMGNPAAFSYSHLFGVMAFIKGVGRHSHYFTASSQDTSNRLAASQFLYGSPMAVPIPDLLRTNLLVMMGANPVVSHGSFLTAPRIKDRTHDIVKRGGRVVVVDPRKTETAAQFEWLGIVPDSDAYLLLSVLQVMFGDGLVDHAFVGRQADGLEWLRALCAPFTPERTAEHTGVDADS